MTNKLTSNGKANANQKAFIEKLASIAEHGMLGLSIALGIKLGLYDAIAKFGSKEKPVTAELLGQKLGLKPRYVQEFLCHMAVCEILHVDESGKKFWMEPDFEPLITGATPHHLFQYNSFIPSFGTVFYELVEICKVGGPHGTSYSQYENFHEIQGSLARSWHQDHFITDFIPLIGMAEKLEKGIKVLDIGCGDGWHMFELGKHYPKSQFIGLDYHEPTITKAKQERDEKKAKNVDFVCIDASKLPKEWENNFDLVLIFEACHDQCRPDLSMKEIQRVLKPGQDGLFAMCEYDGTSNCYRDKREKPHSTLFYGSSLFHCLPIGSNSEDALCLGNMWGVETGKKLLHDCGFSYVATKEIPFFPVNVLYLARK